MTELCASARYFRIPTLSFSHYWIHFKKDYFLSYLVGKLYRQLDCIQKNGLYTDKQTVSYTGDHIVSTVEV